MDYAELTVCLVEVFLFTVVRFSANRRNGFFHIAVLEVEKLFSNMYSGPGLKISLICLPSKYWRDSTFGSLVWGRSWFLCLPSSSYGLAGKSTNLRTIGYPESKNHGMVWVCSWSQDTQVLLEAACVAWKLLEIRKLISRNTG